MAKFVGKFGRVAIGANTVAELKSWSFESSADIEDVTTFSSSRAKDFLPTLTSKTISAEGFWDMTDAQQSALWSAHEAGTAVTLNLYVDSTKRYTGSAFIESISVDVGTEGVATVSYSFQPTGTWTYLAT